MSRAKPLFFGQMPKKNEKGIFFVFIAKKTEFIPSVLLLR